MKGWLVAFWINCAGAELPECGIVAHAVTDTEAQCAVVGEAIDIKSIGAMGWLCVRLSDTLTDFRNNEASNNE